MSEFYHHPAGCRSPATCRSPASGLLCLSAVSTGLGLVCTFGPGLVIINTAGGEDRLELRMELPEEALAKALAPSGSPPAGCRRSWPCSALARRPCTARRPKPRLLRGRLPLQGPFD
jgi:hypothetical protein